MNKKTIIIKITGELFSYERAGTKHTPSLGDEFVTKITVQIKKLIQTHHVGLVVGGGNFFRGAINNNKIGLKASSAHNVGMLSTMVNGIVLQNYLTQADVQSSLLTAFDCPHIAQPVSQDLIDNSFMQNKCVIFVGGTGNPFFTTDTNAVLRALQTNAKEVWKATKVDGVYDTDPDTNADEQKHAPYATISYQEVLDKKLSVMDATAITLAQEHNVPIRVFNVFAKDAFQKALENAKFGTLITKV